MNEESDTFDYLVDEGFGEECATMDAVTRFSFNRQCTNMGFTRRFDYDPQNDALYTKPNMFIYGGYQ